MSKRKDELKNNPCSLVLPQVDRTYIIDSTLYIVYIIHLQNKTTLYIVFYFLFYYTASIKASTVQFNAFASFTTVSAFAAFIFF